MYCLWSLFLMKKLFIIIGFLLIASLGAAVQVQPPESDQRVVTIVYTGEKGDFGFVDQAFAKLLIMCYFLFQ